MKYLFLIIRHLFPRRKWEVYRHIEMLDPSGSGIPIGRSVVLRDQFGNLKTFKL